SPSAHYAPSLHDALPSSVGLVTKPFYFIVCVVNCDRLFLDQRQRFAAQCAIRQNAVIGVCNGILATLSLTQDAKPVVSSEQCLYVDPYAMERPCHRVSCLDVASDGCHQRI